MDANFAQIFADPRVNPDTQPAGDPFQSDDYQRFVESMVPHCHCCQSHRPCDGVLAGGMCDDHQPDDRDTDDDGFDASESSAGDDRLPF